MIRPTKTLGSLAYRGQRKLIVDVLLASGTGLTRDQLVGAVDKDGAYTKTFKRGINPETGATVPQSVDYHIRHLKKLGQIENGKADAQEARLSVRQAPPEPPKIAPRAVDDLIDMARTWYGYGRWDSNYWFIGPEPGMDERENNDLGPRCDAWFKLGGGELVDCKDHHFGFGWYDWHREVPRPRIQKTWEKLITLLLATREGKAPKTEDIREYQQRSWGMKAGETCVAELGSLAGNKLTVRKAIDFDPAQFRKERIEKLRRRIDTYHPRFVVMYRKRDKLSWEQISGGSFGEPWEIRRIGNGSTLAVFADHPVSKVGLSREYWLGIAKALRRKLGWD